MARRSFRLAVLTLLLLGVGLALANSTGPPASETGAAAVGGLPAEGTCRGCHTGNALNSGGTLQILGVPSVYKPDSTYLLTVSLASSQTAGSATRKWGFQITAISAADGKGFGTLRLSHDDTTTTRIIQGSGSFITRFYVEHNSSGTRTGQASPVSWTVRWISPSASAATARALFYAAGNAANGNGLSSGDWIYTSSASALPPARVSTVASLDFGSVIVGATADQTLQVSNSTPPPADTLKYSMTAPAGFTAPGGTFIAPAGAPANSHTISMDTGTSGGRAGDLAISSNDPVTPSRLVAMSGTVLDHAQPSLDSLVIALADTVDFGVHGQGQFRDTTVVIFNLDFGSGFQARLNLTDAVISGGAGRFSIVGGFSPALVGGAPEPIPVRFDDAGATTDSTYSADLTFSCSDEALPGAQSLPSLVVTLRARVTPSAVAVERLDSPGTTRLLPVSPNPARGGVGVALRFDLAQAGHVTLGLFDLRGRQVRSLVREDLQPGSYAYGWEGADDRGSPLPSGVYFARLSAPSFRAVERVTLLR